VATATPACTCPSFGSAGHGEKRTEWPRRISEILTIRRGLCAQGHRSLPPATNLVPAQYIATPPPTTPSEILSRRRVGRSVRCSYDEGLLPLSPGPRNRTGLRWRREAESRSTAGLMENQSRDDLVVSSLWLQKTPRWNVFIQVAYIRLSSRCAQPTSTIPDYSASGAAGDCQT